MTRIAHYVASTHWDREWYETFQGYRMRLVSLLDEVFNTLNADPNYQAFVMDGQVIPIFDYLEVRLDRLEVIRKNIKENRLKIGPWYCLPDEWLVSGESLVRNLQAGMALSNQLGGSSRAGVLCDQFGHISQMPQIFSQLGLQVGFIWRGTHEKEHAGHFNWKSPDGSEIATYRFPRRGYCTYAFEVRDALSEGKVLNVEEAAQKLADFTLGEAMRSPLSPILLFDGGDHLEIEPKTSEMIVLANAKLESFGIQIKHSDLDLYLQDVLTEKEKITKTLTGELRETGREPFARDEQWLIPGVYSSRIHLKQKNAACEDELCIWAEPFCAFARDLGDEYPAGFLSASWKHLLENHPHDSMCGCSIDQVHQDMLYRFDQSQGISSRLTKRALEFIARGGEATPEVFDPSKPLQLTVFNPTAQDWIEPLDLELALPERWPFQFAEFFGFENKPAFKLFTPEGVEVPYQLTGLKTKQNGFRRQRYKFPQSEVRNVVQITARLPIPAFGYAILKVVPVEGPVRYPERLAGGGVRALSHRAIQNEFLKVEVNANGTLKITDHRSGQQFDQLLTYEQRADIGDGWYHGVAVNDQVYSTAASSADVALLCEGPEKAVLRIAVTMNVPEEFDFSAMKRSEKTAALKIVSEITLRAGASRLEVSTKVENNVRDHRLRVLFPTHLEGESFWQDSAYDVIERKIALPNDNHVRRELDVETRPQLTWTAFGSGHEGSPGLAVVTRGLPECTVRETPDRPIALTLLRAFRRAVFSNDNPGGQIQGTHEFKFWITPFSGPAPVEKLFLLGQRVTNAPRAVQTTYKESDPEAPQRPSRHSFLKVEGPVVVTSIQHQGGRLALRAFNPKSSDAAVSIARARKIEAVKSISLDGREDERVSAKVADGKATLIVPGKRIATIVLMEE